MKQNRRTRAVIRITQVESALKRDDSRIHVQTFLEKYFLCEIASKEMLVGYRDLIGDPVNYQDAKMDLRKLKPAFNHFGIGLSNDIYTRLFASRTTNHYRTAKELRNSLVHKMAKRSIEDVNRQYAQLIADMETFLNAVMQC